MMIFRVFGYFRLFRVFFIILLIALIAVVALSYDGRDDGGRAQVAAPKGVDGGSPVYRATLELSDYNLLFTPVKINGHEARALIDSGNYRAVQLSSTMAQSLKLALTKTDEALRHHEGKDLSLETGRLDSLAVGDYERRDVEVGVIEGDIEKIAAQVGTKFDVILGWGFISQFHMLLDYKRRSMQFGPRPLAAGASAFSLKYSVVNRAPVVRGSFGPGNAEEVNLLFDTGAPTCSLDLDLANAPKGAKVSRDLTLAERRIPLEFRAKDLTVIRKSLGCVGVIGNNLLGQYAVYFDPDAKMIHLSRG
jgi:predicted aspartyl protease